MGLLSAISSLIGPDREAICNTTNADLASANFGDNKALERIFVKARSTDRFTVCKAILSLSGLEFPSSEVALLQVELAFASDPFVRDFALHSIHQSLARKGVEAFGEHTASVKEALEKVVAEDRSESSSCHWARESLKLFDALT